MLLLALGGLTGCASETLKMESSMKGDLATTIKLEGPMQIQMQGPTIKYEGTYISDELLEQVDVSKTTDDWVLAVLGEPDARGNLRDGTEIWRWTYRPVEQQSSIVELWSKSDKDPKLASRSVFVQLRSGVVVRKWKG